MKWNKKINKILEKLYLIKFVDFQNEKVDIISYRFNNKTNSNK
jgi:hypothetical protein